jgi:hypothetical protein
MHKIDRNREELIRVWPVSLARLFNRLIRWTEIYCAAGCGYPIGRRFTVTVETIGLTKVVADVCSLGGECERKVLRDGMRDDEGRKYSDFRPDVVEALKESPVPFVHLSLSR